MFSRQFILFLIFGGSAAIVNLCAGLLLYEAKIIIMPYTVSVFLSALSGLIVNFLLNYFFNFKDHPRGFLSHLNSFFIVSLFGTFLTAALSKFILSILDITLTHTLIIKGLIVSNQFIAHFLSVGLVVFYSYIAHKYISFSVGFRKRFKDIFIKLKN